MAKISSIGEGALDPYDPAYKAWSAGASQKTLFQPWPADRLEPPGNPGYEGYGYPAAGYGQSRRKVVPLAKPREEVPQLSTNGWEGKEPQMSKVTSMGTLNKQSDQYPREVIASLMGLGCNCSQTDRRFSLALMGLGQQTTVQQLADAIVRGVVPNSVLSQLHDKLLADEKANAVAYNNIQKLKMLDPSNPQLPALTKMQEEAWGETNTAKFYALLLTEMQSRLGFTSGKPHISPPDYAYIKSGKNPGVFTQAANFLRDKLVGEAAQNLLKAGYMKDSSLKGLGEPVTIGIGTVAAALAAAGIIAYIYSKMSEQAALKSRDAIVQACASGKLSAAACTAALQSGPKEVDWVQLAKYAGLGIGGLVLLQVASSVRNLIPGR